MPDLIDTIPAQVRRLDLQPGDTVVIALQRDIGPDEAERLTEEVKRLLPGQRLLITTPDVRLLP